MDHIMCSLAFLTFMSRFCQAVDNSDNLAKHVMAKNQILDILNS